MKKNLAVLLIMILTLSLCACGKSSDSDDKDKKDNTKTEKNESTETDDVEKSEEEDKETSKKPTKEAKVGSVLDEPEVLFELEEFYIYASFADEDSENGISTMEIALNDKDVPGILYVTDGLLKTNEIVYELDEDGSVTKYTKDSFSENFTKDNASASTLETEKNDMLEILGLFGLFFADTTTGEEYVKCENAKSTFTGDVYVYELRSEGKSLGTIWVDQATGIFVKMLDENGEMIFEVQKIETKNIDIPVYK